MSEDNKKPFSVSDRRHFTSEGEVRTPAAPRDAPPAAAAAPASAATVAPASVAGGEGQDAGERAAAGPSDEHPGPRYPTDFLGLLISLGAQASVLLTGGPEGEPADLEAAHALIELLGSLKDKTEGRRTPEEDQLFEGLLYELRMAYVQATRAGGR
ncbi:MAG TPA: DUF1844 domain-containing protein [Vicinamibacteria bacterium]|nr:DUF1844 domain-containing protein [Vicinamibacteria bacterium]